MRDQQRGRQHGRRRVPNLRAPRRLRPAHLRLQADRTTQPRQAELCDLDAVSNPSSLRLLGGVKTSAGSAKPVRSPATRPWVAKCKTP